MPITIAERLQELGLTLPQASPPAANYISTMRSGDLLFVSGQISMAGDTSVFRSQVGAQLSVEDGRRAAEVAALNVLAQIAAATDGTLSAVRRVVRLGVFVAAKPDFTQHSPVANGASDLLVAVFGDAGRHARTAVGVASLPAGVAVEVDAIVALAGFEA